MNLVTDQTEVITSNRDLPEPDWATVETPLQEMPLPPAPVRSTPDTGPIVSGFGPIRVAPLAGDADSSNLINFPFAFTAFANLGSGVLAMCWGIVISSAWLTVTGLLFALAGGCMYGWSLRDD